MIASDYYLIPNRIDRYSIVGIDSLRQVISKLVRNERLRLKCIGLVYTIVHTTNIAKQERIRIDFESKKSVEDIYIFSSFTSIANNIQYGVAGTIPTKYVASKQDIEAITIELIDRIEILEQEGGI